MISEKLLFSVIVPLYNKELSIQETLVSVLNQTEGAYEVIVVDDGSSDNSYAIAHAQAQRDHRIKVYQQHNGGVSAARNYAITKAKGEYIAFLDADDFWDNTFLENMLVLITSYPDCGMYCCAYKAVKRNNIIYNCQHLPEGIVSNYFEIILQYRISWTSATVIRKNVFDKAGMFPVGMVGGEDYYMWAKVAKDHKVAFTPKVLASYNMVFSTSLSRIGQQDRCSESWFELYSAGDFYLNEFIAKKAIENGIRHAWGNHKTKSRVIEAQFKYTTLFRSKWRKLHYLNRFPKPMLSLMLLYKKLVTYYYVSFSGNF